jgi:hypothetical protein
MGFFADLVNYVVHGIVLNLVTSIIGFFILLGIGMAFIWLFQTINENEVFKGIFTTQSDNPTKVALLCFLTPPSLILLLGLLIGYVLSVFELFVYFLWNLWPFGPTWGEKDGFLIMVKLWSNLVELPLSFLNTAFVAIFSTPIVLFIVLAISTLLFFGILWPSGHNKGSLSSSNAEYAAISLSSLFFLIGVISILAFGGILSSVAETKYQYFEENEEGSTPYFFIDPLEHPDFSENERERAEKFQQNINMNGGDSRNGVVILECNSLNSLYDFSDTFVYTSELSSVPNYHVMIKSSESYWLFSESDWLGERPVERDDFDINDFTTSDLNRGNDAKEFRIQIPEVDIEFVEYESLDFTLIKYHIAYVPFSDSNESNSSQMLAAALEQAGSPSTCDSYSLSGTLESKVRMSSLGFLFSGTFLIGCCFHRFYIVGGRYGATNQRTLIRSFLLSQGVMGAVIAILVLMFDPLDGSGVTGISTEQIVNAGIFAAKVIGITLSLLFVSVIVIVLIGQREYIGEMIEIERTRAEVDDWFD